MRIIYLDVFHFRNLTPQRLSFPSRVTRVIGRNGHGKTSLLEAVFILAHGKSFRATSLADVVRWPELDPEDKQLTEARLSMVEGAFATSSGEKTVRCEIKGAKRTILLNGKKVEKAGEFYGQLSCVCFTPDDLQLVKGPPALRRQFLDRVLAIVDKKHIEHLVGYQRALRNRNSVLTEQLKSGASAEQSKRLLEPWNIKLAELGREVTKKRLQLKVDLQQKFVQTHRVMAGEETSERQVVLGFEGDFTENEELLSFEQIMDHFEVAYQKDFRLGRTSFGCQRDKLVLSFDAAPSSQSVRRSVSQGQARSLALALCFSCVDYLKERTGEWPLLLLDDVESELDASRREALGRLLSDISCQVIITATEAETQSKSAAGELGILEISEGAVEGAETHHFSI